MGERKQDKDRLRDILSVKAARTVNRALHLAGRPGTSLPGKVALSISPSLLQDLAAGVGRTIFAVCGTNGKTTVNNLLCGFLEAEGYAVICNRLGANMQNGIASAFALDASLPGRQSAAYACLEIDEAAAPAVFPMIRPDYLILTNLFRDQLDRYGEIDLMMEKLALAIRSVPDLKLVVNADDPLSVYLAEESEHPYVAYGITEHVRGSGEEREDEVREGRFCKKCGTPLIYEYYHYSQMGVWKCPGCSLARPVPAYEASGITTDSGLSFRVGNQRIRTTMTGLYSVYNILAVFGALSEDGHGQFLRDHLQDVLSDYHPQFGRGESFEIGGKRVILILAKNPAGFNQNIRAVLDDGREKDLIIVINDNEQDGRDISWLWDVDFDLLGDPLVRSVTAGGTRALDLALRFRYVEIRASVTDNIREAIETKLTEEGGNLYVLVNYTALYELHRILRRMEGPA